MKARGILFAIWTASVGMRAEGQAPPDWFDAFRGRAFLQGDASFVAREGSAAPDSPPLFRARWVVVRYSGFTEKEREFWPYRNLLLVTMPSGARYVLESSFGFVDETHLDEDRPFQRVASEKAAIEVWMSGTFGETPDPAVEPGPCEGNRERVRAPGGSLEFFLDDLASRTVRAAFTEFSEATFGPDERRDLVSLLALSPESNPALPGNALAFNVRNAFFAGVVVFRDGLPPREKRTVVLAPDPLSTTDLAPWRALAHLPLDLPPFPVIVPENPIQ